MKKTTILNVGLLVLLGSLFACANNTPTTAAPTTNAPTTTLVPTTTATPTTTVTPTTQTPTTQTPTTVVPVTNTISGNIIDNAGSAVKDVSVYLNVGSTTVQIAKSNESGAFSFTDVSAATYNLILVPPSDGYEYKGEKISFTYEGGSLTLDTIVLTKSNMNWGSLS